jgi:hypothetical protein
MTELTEWVASLFLIFAIKSFRILLATCRKNLKRGATQLLVICLGVQNHARNVDALVECSVNVRNLKNLSSGSVLLAS